MRLPDEVVDWFHTAYVRPALPGTILVFVCHGLENERPYCYINKMQIDRRRWSVPISGDNRDFDDLPKLLQYRLLLPAGKSYLTHYPLVRARHESGENYDRSSVVFKNPEEIQEMLQALELR